MQAAPSEARASSPTPGPSEDSETGEVANQRAARCPALPVPLGPGDALEHRPGRPRQQSQGAGIGVAPAGVHGHPRPAPFGSANRSLGRA